MAYNRAKANAYVHNAARDIARVMQESGLRFPAVRDAKVVNLRGVCGHIRRAADKLPKRSAKRSQYDAALATWEAVIKRISAARKLADIAA